MTTREQLGLNANWIPMDSSRSGGSDEFLVKKVNQLEDGLRLLKESSYFSVLSKNNDGDTKFTAWVDDRFGTANLELVVGLKNAKSNVRIKFKTSEDTTEYVELGYNDTYSVKFNEVTTSLQAKYGVHVYYARLTLNDVKISGVINLNIELNSELRSKTGFTYSSYDSVHSTSKLIKEVYIIEDRNNSKIISRDTKVPESEKVSAIDIISSSTVTDMFNILNKPSKSDIYLDYRNGITRYYRANNSISNAPRVNVLEHFGDGRWVESEIVWRSPTDELKEKVKPLVVTNNMSTGGVDSDYGYMGNKSGWVVYPYAPSINGCLSYAYRTDCGEWLGYFFVDEAAKFIKNADKVPNYAGLPFSRSTNAHNEQWTEYPTSVPIPSDSVYSNSDKYIRENLKKLMNLFNEQIPAINNFRFRYHLGLVFGDFDNNQTYEVWSFVPNLVNSNANRSTSALSSLIDSNTGDFRTAYSEYALWKDSKCVIHQTLAKDGDFVVVKEVELTTLDKFFKNFIAKSGEWMTKNPDKVENGTPKGNYDRRYVWGGVYDRL